MNDWVRQRGFVLLESVVGVLIVLGLVLGGWYILQSGREPEARSGKPAASKSEGHEEQVIAITEWGVEFVVTDALKADVRQGLFTFQNGDQAVYFASRKLAAAGPGCDLTEVTDGSGSGVSGGSIALGRTKERPEPPGRHSFQHGGFWYTVSFANSGACYEHDDGRAVEAFNTQMEVVMRRLRPAEK